jgi:hypothetical protein
MPRKRVAKVENIKPPNLVIPRNEAENQLKGRIEKDVEIMTDYSGVVYLPMDDGDAWKLDLAKEINFAGILVDFNKVIL